MQHDPNIVIHHRLYLNEIRRISAILVGGGGGGGVTLWGACCITANLREPNTLAYTIGWF
jgi:hypothetical protein